MANSENFSLRIVSLDHYMASPIPGLDMSYSSFQGGKVNEVPVIRIYGSTPAGQKTCLHIHRVLPYLYVPCADLPIQSQDGGDAYTHKISLAVEKALQHKSKASSKRQYVHGCDLVRGKKFYGYHSSEELFVQIYLYYPQDVSRAANILLSGGVLGKCLQPHEAHIPYILQFLVDYNLYGMGHVHLSKVKFRNPVPDVFSPRKYVHTEQSRQDMDPLIFQDPNSQAGISGNLASDSPVWISSTIPADWNPGICSAKRQSLCHLEGDSTVDEILNQQSRTYTSLSQTRADVKMVQSLAPIWEEEYERTGMQVIDLLSDSSKPLPQDVLKTLSSNPDYSMELNDLHNEVESPVCLTPYDKDIRPVNLAVSVEREKNVMALYQVLHNAGKKSDSLKEKVLHGSLPSQEEKKLISSTESVANISCSDELGLSKMIERFDEKPADREAMTLLKWLASSQAEDDINSDDELLRETILSPFLTKTIEEVLERANKNYESESQKECQEILDTIQDFIVSKDVSERDNLSVNENSPGSSQRITHQDTGVENDIELTPDMSFEDLSKIELGKIDKASEHPVFEDSLEVKEVEGSRSSVAHTNKRKKKLWGPLPFSKNQTLANEQEPSNANPLFRNNCGHESSSLKNIKEIAPLVDCSVRDLMRRKRKYRVDSAHCCSSGVEKVPIDVKQREDTNISARESMVHHSTHTDPLKGLLLSRSDSALDGCAPGVRKSEGSDNSDAQKYFFGDPNYIGSEAAISPCKTGQEPDLQLLKSDHENKTSDKAFDIINVDGVRYSQSAVRNVELGGETGSTGQFSTDGKYQGGEAPPSTTNLQAKDVTTADWMDETSVKASSCPIISDNPSSDKASERRPLDDCSQQEQNCLNVGMTDSDITLQQKVNIGVPTVYQNDGSYLYILSPMISPPTADSVKIWLSTVGTSVEDATVPTKSLSEKETYRPVTDPPCSSSDDFNKLSPESRSTYHEQHIQPPGSQEKRDIVSTIRNVNCNKETSTKQRKGDSVHVKAFTDCSQDISQISGPAGKSKATPLSQTGFRDPASVGGGQQLTLLSVEIQAASRGDLRPDPRFDAINIITLAIQNDSDYDAEVHVLLHAEAEASHRNLNGITGCNVMIFCEEKSLFDHFIKFVHSLDPDIVMGWDVQGSSLGFLAERASNLGVGLLNSISRTPPETKMASGDAESPIKGLDDACPDPAMLEDTVITDEWGRTHASGVHVGGRIVLNVWRLMRGELSLNMYTIEAVADAVLRRKIPCIPYRTLTKWFSSGPARARYRCIEYVKNKAKLNLELMTQHDMINRTSELARVFGIDFFSVLSRGSQYRVESMYLRLAHTQNYLAVSPGSQQVASQPAMECIPLVMEPESNFYADPVVVLDFQSLYPSMIIAYNLCYSTCVGNISPSKENVLGVTTFSPDQHNLRELKDQILLTPNGVMYVPSKVRKGVLPRLLEEILSTRIMVKQAMKKLSVSQKVLHRIFNARQLALKLIANVTYGYTAAGFSGRMPCAELADSIVQCGRRTLERAISFVNSQEKWKGRVIYGDTDSMFVLLKGRSVEDAFRIGNEIASEITAMNPNPVVLKMEKVYHPCVLLTKKRYVGYSYESPNQKEPVFDAKGIETVRRDTCKAVSRTMEQSLRIFFERQDISEVKGYLQRQWNRILSGRVSLQDFVFAKEVRLGSYSTKDSSSLPPAAIVASKAMRGDPRAEPRYGDRIPYVVVHGQPGARLVDMVVDPLELLALDSPYRLNDLYYITKQIIPALQRVFGLVGADLHKWFFKMPRTVREALGKRPVGTSSNPLRTRIDYYYLSRHCILCGELVEASTHLCKQCSQNEAAAVITVVGRTSKLEREMQHLAAICRYCGGGDWIVESGVKCNSLACGVFYERCKVQKELQGLASVAADKGLYPKCMVEWF